MDIREMLEADHDEIEGLHSEIDKALALRKPELVLEKVDLFWARLAMHIRAEHLRLFPALLRKNELKFEKLIELLREDHNVFMHELAGVMKTLRGVSNEPAETVREKIMAVAIRLERHNEIEEKRIYPLVDNLFDEDEIKQISAGVKKELENLPPRFNDQLRNTEKIS